MGHNFSVDEVFEMAEMMERNGAEFYRKTADKTEDPKLKEFLVGLSNLELSHAAMFRRWREELAGVDPEKKFFDPEDEGAQYLKTIVDGQVSFEHEEHGTGTLEEILKGAIASEKDTVIFYLNMRESIPDYFDAHKIDRIIREELEHIRSMTRKMRQLSLESAQKAAS